MKGSFFFLDTNKAQFADVNVSLLEVIFSWNSIIIGSPNEMFDLLKNKEAP